MSNAVGFVDFERRGELHLCMAFLQWSFNVVKFPEDLNRDGKMVRVMLTSTHRRWMIVMVLILVSATAQMASADGEVTWHLKRIDATGFNYTSGHEYDLIMTKESPAPGNAKWFKFGPGNESWWYANYSAECNLTFPSGEWNVTFKTQLNAITDNTKSVEVHLWRLFKNGTAAEIINKSEVVDTKGEKWHTVLLAPNVIDVEKGERIALSFKWASDASDWMSIGCDSVARDSTLTSPPDSPVYPVPELPTLTLFSVGLLIIAGCAYMGRRAE